jgi:hypothetical protein
MYNFKMLDDGRFRSQFKEQYIINQLQEEQQYVTRKVTLRKSSSDSESANFDPTEKNPLPSGL